MAIICCQDFLEQRQNVFGVVDNENSGCHKHLLSLTADKSISAFGDVAHNGLKGYGSC
jgi:hypothetical protein